MTIMSNCTMGFKIMQNIQSNIVIVALKIMDEQTDKVKNVFCSKTDIFIYSRAKYFIWTDR